MIVEVWFDAERNRISEPHEVDAFIARVMKELKSERKVAVGFDPGSTATFHVFDAPEGEVPDRADNSLTVGLNRAAGYGGMIWWGEEIPENPDQFYWVTKGTNLPSYDPRVTADPGYPLWYQGRSVVPAEKVRAAIEEFCYRNGKRPTVVEWEPCNPSGQPLHAE
ncbi:Imm1 family immunity protein [Streptomyces flaveolus]|uniref:Imm1 family immunity protein n=1 Tax=Streptomyces flaveolus TaxID=67297 RepID=A0ABV1VB88_9ACTN